MVGPSAPLGFHPILDGKITETDLLTFLSQAEPEGQVLEYKEGAEAKKALQTVAGFANTHGGYLLVGVGEERRDGRTVPKANPTPMPAGSGAAFRSRCFDVLDPPWVPDVVEVEVGGAGEVVLVVRVPAMPQLRPLVHAGTVYLRYGDQTRGAPREEIRRLFTEGTTGEVSYLPNPAAYVGPTGVSVDLPGKWFTVRAVASAAVNPGMPLLPIDNTLRPAVITSVRSGPGADWLDEWATRWGCSVGALGVPVETSSTRFGLARAAEAPMTSTLVLHERVVVSATNTPPNAGFLCVCDLSLSSVNLHNASRTAAGQPTQQGQKPDRLAVSEVQIILAAALAQAEATLRAVVDAHDEPRPRAVHYAAGFIGDIDSNVDFASLGRFTRSIPEALQTFQALIEPRPQANFGDLDALAVAAAFLERLILDSGHVAPLS